MDFVLRRGSKVLARITKVRPDMPWFEAVFEPEPAFEDVRPLFDRAQALIEAERFDAEAWEKTWQRVRDLGVRLVSNDGTNEIDEFALYVSGATCRFRF